MVQSLGATDAKALIDLGEVDVIDVRDAREYAGGHIPGARLLPLDELKPDPKAKLTRDNVLFVCAKGIRSATAAKLAEGLGFGRLYTLEGGTQAWVAAGLPLERPEAPSPTAPGAPRADDSCPAPPPSLDQAVGHNLHALRTARGWSLDQVAKATGLSRHALGQIETGRASPPVSSVWRLANAFEVPFSALLASSAPAKTLQLPAKRAKRLSTPDGRFSSRALYALNEHPTVEFYELYLAPHSTEEANAHAPGTRENLVVASGQLELVLGKERFALEQRDAIEFTADVPHSYVNPASTECWMYLVMTYPAGSPR